MAVPNRKCSKARTRARRTANERRTKPGVTYCENCSAPKPPHRVCPTCGYYDARRGHVIETGFTESAEG